MAALWTHLNERQRRLLLGAEAREMGRGGIAAVARAAEVSRPTVRKAIRELEEVPIPVAPDRVRHCQRPKANRRTPRCDCRLSGTQGSTNV